MIRRKVVFHVKQMWSVFLSLGTVVGLFFAFRSHGYEPGDQDNAFDSWLLFFLGVGYGMAVLNMIILNEEWPLRAHGQLWTYVADALIWGIIGADRIGLRRPIMDNELTLIRASFIVGIACLIIGLLIVDVGVGLRHLKRRHKVDSL